MKLEKLDDFYLEESERPLISSILPGYYVDHSMGGINADYAIRFLQNELNAILNSFINGGFSHRGFILYPFVKDVSKENIRRLMRLEKIAAFLAGEGYDFSAGIGSFEKNIGRSTNFAEALSGLYCDFSRIRGRSTNISIKPKCREFNFGSYKKQDSGYLRPLNELKGYARKNLKQYLSGFYLHGSFATRDYIRGWSDVDTLAIISKETMGNPKELIKLRSRMYSMRHFFYRIDPLQHHGSIIISEHDLQDYCQAYFPIPIFRHARSFFENDKASRIRTRSYSSEALAELFWFVSYFRKLNAEKVYSMGSYDLKILLHSITLFPSLYLQAKSISVYKKSSFGIARKDFKEKSWKVINEVSALRKSWNGPKTTPLTGIYSKINPLLSYQLGSRFMDIFNGISKSNIIDVKRLVGGIYSLSEEAWGMVKQNAKRKI